jgi:hypothetical protein
MVAWLEEMKTVQERMEAKMDANLKEMKACQQHLKAEIMAYLKTQIGCLASSTEVNKKKWMHV